jgi:hypothetical protein
LLAYHPQTMSGQQVAAWGMAVGVISIGLAIYLSVVTTTVLIPVVWVLIAVDAFALSKLGREMRRRSKSHSTATHAHVGRR